MTGIKLSDEAEWHYRNSHERDLPGKVWEEIYNLADRNQKLFLPLANAQGQELDELRKREDVKWTFISPAGDFQADGERSGEYILAGEELTLNERGESIISYADYAIAMVDEIEKGDHIRQRISVVRK